MAVQGITLLLQLTEKIEFKEKAQFYAKSA